jgi:hypothetical protein
MDRAIFLTVNVYSEESYIGKSGRSEEDALMVINDAMSSGSKLVPKGPELAGAVSAPSVTIKLERGFYQDHGHDRIQSGATTHSPLQRSSKVITKSRKENFSAQPSPAFLINLNFTRYSFQLNINENDKVSFLPSSCLSCG